MGLADIFSSSSSDISDAWNSTDAADEFGPLPPGEYIAHILSGELFESRTNHTPGYKLTFKVIEGDYINRRFWHECWLTKAAMPQTKRDLAKIGITEPSMLEEPIPPRKRCKCKLVVRKDDNGNEFNRVKSFEFIRDDELQVDEFDDNNGAPF